MTHASLQVLAAADRYKKQRVAAAESAQKGDAKYKHGAALEPFVSSFVFLAGPDGKLAGMWPRDTGERALADDVVSCVRGE